MKTDTTIDQLTQLVQMAEAQRQAEIKTLMACNRKKKVVASRKKLGRPRLITDTQMQTMRDLSADMTVSELALLFGISRATVYRIVPVVL